MHIDDFLPPDFHPSFGPLNLLALGLPLFFLTRGGLGSSTAILLMVAVMMPFFLLAMYEKNGQPLEKVVRNIVQVAFLRPKKRPYETNNFYAAVERQEKLDKEVLRIVQGEKAHKSRKAAD